MNERIRELAEQAREWAEVSYKKQNDQFTSHWDNPIGYTPTQFFEQKFAELIVRECMELAMTEKSRYANLYNKEADPNKYLTMLHCATSMDNYRLLLEQHFGVKP